MGKTLHESVASYNEICINYAKVQLPVYTFQTPEVYIDTSIRRETLFGLEVRGIKHQTHQYTPKRSSNRNSSNPRKKQEANSLEINSLQRAIAETDTDGGAGDAHGCRDGKGELREDEDGDSGAHFHGAASAGGVVSDFVAHDCSNKSANIPGLVGT